MAAAVEWQIITLHYSALHYIEAYFATKNVHSKNHPERDERIQRDPNTQPIYRNYSRLKIFSHNARYLTVGAPKSRVTEMEKHLAAIKTHLSQFVEP